MPPTTTTDEVTDLLQHLIRNQCVNDGSVESGHEDRSAEVLSQYLGGAGLDVAAFEPAPGRRSLVARIEGTRTDAPTLLLCGHLDVVPATSGWRHDPFGGELIDGEVWGRGAVDMLNLTAAMAVAVRRIAQGTERLAGTLVFVAAADEEATGAHGTGWLVEHEAEAVAADGVLTEYGGVPVPGPGGVTLPVLVGEKGATWCRLTVRGVPAHASAPYGSTNALVLAAGVVERLARYSSAPRLPEGWRDWLASLDIAGDTAAALADPGRLDAALAELPPQLAAHAHACTHMTMAPTVVHGGTKTNVIPDRIDLDVDVRALPGTTEAEVRAALDEAIGDLARHVEITGWVHEEPSASPAGSPLWDAVAVAGADLSGGGRAVPWMTPAATDARFFRRRGTTAYGAGLFSPRMTWERFTSMFHGDDERVDQESLGLSTAFFEQVARRYLAAD